MVDAFLDTRTTAAVEEASLLQARVPYGEGQPCAKSENGRAEDEHLRL
jgi:hypothetical protein